MYRVASSLIRSAASRRLKLWCKEISFGVGARAGMLQGVDEIAEAVKVTMGPKGRNVVIERDHKGPIVTKDGVTVAKSIKFSEGNKSLGAELVNRLQRPQIPLLETAILVEGCKSIATGVNAMDLRSGINMAVDAVVSDLKSRAVMISTPEEITQVATISANGEREIGELIARAMEKVGKEGVITVSDGNTLDDELEVVEGMKLARGYISPYFITDQKFQKCELENPLILIHEKKISDVGSLVKVLELAIQMNRPLLIVAEYIEGEALTLLILNKHQAGLKVCAIKAPGFGESRKANLDDLAVFTGGEVSLLHTELSGDFYMFIYAIHYSPRQAIAEERGLTLDKIQPEMLGSAKKVTISMDDTVVLSGSGDKKVIEERCEELRTSMEESTSTFDKEKAQERLSKLSGGVAVFKVGASSEAELGERKDRVTDALNATRAAVEEGIVPGGGVALLYATKALEKIQTKNEDQKRGVQIVLNALKAPAFTIVSNAGGEAPMVIGKLLEQNDHHFGYDASKGEYVNMVKAGIIDPVKVIRTALVDAASVSSLLTTTEAAVIEHPEQSRNPQRVPDMDQMDL
ncbi:Chaperonin CPN60-like 2 mitochondrial [Bienertia sinuspersici]